MRLTDIKAENGINIKRSSKAFAERTDDCKLKKSFEEYRREEDADFISSVDATKYVVLDVETNGLSSKRDDLLSLAIYKPDTDDVYNKFFPLELNKTILTTAINGITKGMLKGATAYTQAEFDSVVDKYELKTRTILSYGSLDERFVKEYLRRHDISGFEHLHFYNFKHDIISSRFSEGNITKDNLCNLFFIDGVNSIHAADNDCILEWKLYQRLNGGQLLITNNKVFEFNKNEYIVPISYISTFPNFKYHLPDMPKIIGTSQIIKRISICTTALRKFETNFNGMTLEHLINRMLNATEINSRNFLLKNKAKMKYVGLLPSEIDVVPMIFKEDGTVQSTRPQDKSLEKELNAFVTSLKEGLTPLIECIKQEVFKGQAIFSQELVIHKDANILALCDLSSEDSVLEIKMTNYVDASLFATQIYYEANGRVPYILQADWSNMPNELSFILSRLELTEFDILDNGIIRENKAKEKVETEAISLVKYVDCKSPVTLKCKTCNHEWVSSYMKAVRHAPCPYCNPKVSSQHENRSRTTSSTLEERRKKSEEIYISKIYKKSEGIFKISGYTGAKSNVEIECTKCGKSWTSRADHFAERCRCRFCDADYSK